MPLVRQLLTLKKRECYSFLRRLIFKGSRDMLFGALLFWLASGGIVAPPLAEPRTSYEDRIKGALLASAFADACGRLTIACDDRLEIERLYGTEDLNTFKHLRKEDWVFINPQKKVALLGENTFVGKQIFERLINGRENSFNKTEVAHDVAETTAANFGAYKNDPFFEMRRYTTPVINKGEELARLRSERKNSPWWLKSELSSQEFNELLIPESDSSALLRVLPTALVFADQNILAKDYAVYFSSITNRHPSAQAAAAALTVGILYALQGLTVDEIVFHMVQAAESYEPQERIYKPAARRLRSRENCTADKIRNNEMLTSDMILYAFFEAKGSSNDDTILGISSKKNIHNRSYRNALLGDQADEAVAAAVYLFVRYIDDYKSAVKAAAHASGNSALIGSLAGALIGAKKGYTALSKGGLSNEVVLLENFEELDSLAQKAAAILDSGRPYIPRETPNWSRTILILGALGLLGLLGYTAATA
jgi:ADP-ribosylglycohydrolase